MKNYFHAVLVCVAVSVIGILNTAVMCPSLEVSSSQTDLWRDHGAIKHNLRIVILAIFSISGAGCGLVHVCAYEAVKKAYTIYRNFVYGVLGCVSYTGYILGPWAFKVLMTSYTWRGALLILVGVVMNIIPLSILLPGGSGQEHVPYQPLPRTPILAEGRNGRYRSHGRKKGIPRSRCDLQSEDLETLWEPSFPTQDGLDSEVNNSRTKVIKVLRKTGFYALLFAGVLYAYGSSVVFGVIENYTVQDLSEVKPTFTLFITTGVTVCVWTLFQGAVMNRVEPLYWFAGFACVGGFLTFVFMLPVPLIVIYVYGGLLGISIAGTGRGVICPIITNLAGADNFAFLLGIYVCLTSLARLLGCPTTSVWNWLHLCEVLLCQLQTYNLTDTTGTICG